MMRTSQLFLSAMVAASALWAVTAAQGLPTPSRPLTEAVTGADVAADMDFLLQAWLANDRALEAARVALKRSRDVRVRQFARSLVRDHLAADARIRRLAASRGLGVPAEARAVSPAAHFGLERLRGAAFDRQFVAAVGVRAHRETLELFRKQARQGRDHSLARFASDGIPVLRHHLAQAEALQAQAQMLRRNAPRTSRSGG